MSPESDASRGNGRSGTTPDRVGSPDAHGPGARESEFVSIAAAEVAPPGCSPRPSRTQAAGDPPVESLDLLPSPFVLHVCEREGCNALAFGARCERHTTPEDRQRLHALTIALLVAGEAEEVWRDKRVLVLEAQEAAGVRRQGT